MIEPFSLQYAPLGDMSSNIGEAGLGELYSKRVAAQVAAALAYIHSKVFIFNVFIHSRQIECMRLQRRLYSVHIGL